MIGRAWEPDELAFLRAEYGAGVLSLEDFADALERTPKSVRSMVRKLGLKRENWFRRPWTEDELIVLRRDYKKRLARDIAAEIGRTMADVHCQARRQGLSEKNPPLTQNELDEIRRLNAQGFSDTEIADKLGRERHNLGNRRKAMGLPCNSHSDRVIGKISAGVQRQVERLGLSRVTDLRTEAFKRFARESGWPEDLRPREVQILNVLADRGVPMSRLELAEAIGMRTDRMGKRAGGKTTLNLLPGNGPGGTYTASLMRRGLILKLTRGAIVHGKGKGKSRDLYFLGPAAITILEARAQCQQQMAIETV